MSNTLSGQNLGVFPYNLDGMQNIDATSINGQTIDPTKLVKYSGNTAPLDMGAFNIKTAYAATATTDVVNLASLNTQLSTLTNYIIGINGLNYVKYTNSTSNTDLGSYGMSASTLTATSSLTVSGTTILNGNTTLNSSLTVSGATTCMSTLNVSGLTTLARGQTNFTATTALDITNKAYVDNAIANISVGTNLLTTNNVFSGTNDFNNNLTTGFGYTTDLNGVIQTKLNSLAFTSASFTTSGITGTYSYQRQPNGVCG